jgi:hypothetical protein
MHIALQLPSSKKSTLEPTKCNFTNVLYASNGTFNWTWTDKCDVEGQKPCCTLIYQERFQHVPVILINSWAGVTLRYLHMHNALTHEILLKECESVPCWRGHIWLLKEWMDLQWSSRWNWLPMFLIWQHTLVLVISWDGGSSEAYPRV